MKELTNFSKLDVSIILRAFSILLIVSGHLNLLNIAGGSYYLFFLSGFNFILFTVPKVENLNNADTSFNPNEFLEVYLKFLSKIIIPTLLYTLFLYSFLGVFHIQGLLFISNFFGPMYANGLTFWFIEVLVQIYLLFGIVFLIINKFFFAYKFFPYKFMVFGFVFSYIFSVICRLYWDTSLWLDRFPHLLIYMFFAGAAVALSRNLKLKLITSLALTITVLDFIIFGWDQKIIFLIIGAYVTLWLPYFLVPQFISYILKQIAMASLFIYLTHFQSYSLLNKLNIGSMPFFNVLFSVILGIFIFKLWKFTPRLVLSLMKTK